MTTEHDFSQNNCLQEYSPWINSVAEFAVDKLIDESQQNEGLGGVLNKIRMEKAKKNLYNGKPDNSIEILKKAALRYELMDMIDGAFFMSRNTWGESERPFHLKWKFYESVALILTLKAVRDNAVKGKESRETLDKKYEIEKLVEKHLTGNALSQVYPNQLGRLLEKTLRLKEKVWFQEQKNSCMDMVHQNY